MFEHPYVRVNMTPYYIHRFILSALQTLFVVFVRDQTISAIFHHFFVHLGVQYCYNKDQNYIIPLGSRTLTSLPESSLTRVSRLCFMLAAAQCHAFSDVRFSQCHAQLWLSACSTRHCRPLPRTSCHHCHHLCCFRF